MSGQRISTGLKGGITFRQEFHSLPQFEPPAQQLPGQLIRITRTNETTGRNVLPLLIGSLPTTHGCNYQFWNAVLQHDVSAIISVNIVSGDNSTGRVAVTADNYCLPSDFVAVDRPVRQLNYNNFTWQRVTIRSDEVDLWSFTDWPTVNSNRLVPIVPHIFLDFIRVIIKQMYSQYTEANKPLLIVGRTLDIPALVASIFLLSYQACQEARVDVFQRVSSLRQLCNTNVISNYALYEFIYDCLLQVMTSTPTVMTGNKTDFAHIFNHLIRRPQGDRFGIGKNFFDMGANREVEPIRLQYDILTNLSRLYHERLFPAKKKPSQKRQNHPFAPILFNNSIWYSVLPSFNYRKQFLAIRGPVAIDGLLQLMKSNGSRTLLWISETTNPPDILNTSGNTSRGGISLGRITNYGQFYTFPLTMKQPSWHATVFHFSGWPISSGIRPIVSNENLLTMLHELRKHSEAIQIGLASETSHVITILEARNAVVRVAKPEVVASGNSCCQPRRQDESSLVEGCTWRGVMLALINYLDERMTHIGEVDIYRTTQLFRMFDPFRVAISLHQYVWLYKMAWESCCRRYSDDERDNTDSELTTPRHVTFVDNSGYDNWLNSNANNYNRVVNQQSNNNKRPPVKSSICCPGLGKKSKKENGYYSEDSNPSTANSTPRNSKNGKT